MDKAGLRNQFKNLLNRNDCPNALADTFIEQAMGRVQRTLRIPSMEQSFSVTFTELNPSFFILPNTFLEFIDLFVETQDGHSVLKQIPRGRFLEKGKYAGFPEYYTRFGPAVNVKPIPPVGTTLTMLYYGEMPDLVADTDRNILSDAVPDLLVYCALSFACDYFVDARKQSFEATYIQTFDEIQAQANQLEFSGSEMQIQPMSHNY